MVATTSFWLKGIAQTYHGKAHFLFYHYLWILYCCLISKAWNNTVINFVWDHNVLWLQLMCQNSKAKIILGSKLFLVKTNYESNLFEQPTYLWVFLFSNLFGWSWKLGTNNVNCENMTGMGDESNNKSNQTDGNHTKYQLINFPNSNWLSITIVFLPQI